MSALWEWFKGLPTPAKWGLGIGAGLLVLYIVKSGKGSTASVSQVTTPTDTTLGDTGGDLGGSSGSGTWGGSEGGGGGGSTGNGSGGVGSGGSSTGGTVGGSTPSAPTTQKTPTPTTQQPATKTATVISSNSLHPTAPTVNRTPSVPVNTTGYGSGATSTQTAYNRVQAIQVMHNPDFQKPSPPPAPYTKAVQQVNYNRVSAIQTMHNPDFQKPRPTPKPTPSYNYSAPSWHPTVQYSTPNRDSGNHNSRGRNHAI